MIDPLHRGEPRALRALGARWPYRRFHTRHDLHLLKRILRDDCLLRVSGRPHRRRALKLRGRRRGSG